MKNRIVLLIMLVFTGVCFGAATTHDPWDGTVWVVTSPNDEALVGNTYKEIYDLRKGVALRMNYEHETLATSSAGGTHKQGSAVAFFQDAEEAKDGDDTFFATATDAGHFWIDTNATPDNRLMFLLTADGAGAEVWEPIATSLSGETWTWTGNATWDDGTTDSPTLTLTDATNEDCAIVKKDNGDTTVTIPADTDFEIVTGNLAVGNGSPGTAAMDGEDAYVEGELEVDGVATLDGNVTVGGTLDVTGNIDPTTFETTNGGFIDEDSMATDSAVKVCSQQSIKAYVDAQSIPFCRAFLKTTAQTIGTASWTTIEFNNDSDSGLGWDSWGTYSTADYKITPGVAGYYLVSAQMTIANLGAGKGVGIRIHKNGTTDIAVSTQSGYVAADILPGCNVTDIVYLDDDDYIVIQAFQNSGSNKDISAGSNQTYVMFDRMW